VYFARAHHTPGEHPVMHEKAIIWWDLPETICGK